MAVLWKEYQEETAEFFRSLALAAATDVGPEGNFRQPSEIDFEVPIQELRSLAGYALAATDQAWSDDWRD